MKQCLKGHLQVKELDTPVQKEPKHYVWHVSKKKPTQLCDITPESSQGVRQKAWQVRQYLPKDNLKQEAVISEILWIENAKVGARKQLYCDAKNTSLTQEMIQIASLRHKKKFSQLETIVDGIKKKYKSLGNAHKLVKHDLNWKRFQVEKCMLAEKCHV